VSSRDNIVEVSGFTEREANILLTNMLSTAAPERQNLNSLSEELGYLPLALSQAAAFIDSFGITVADYLEYFRGSASRIVRYESHG
jgi:purine-cytosine permease-like protein